MNNKSDTESWLKPSEALNRVSLPADWGDETGGTAEWEERRYGFNVGSVNLLIGRGTPSEIPERADVYPLPGVPAWFHGLLNLRGNLVPVFDVARLLAHRGEVVGRERVLILDRGEAGAGILIEGFPRAVGRLRALPQRPPLPRVLQEFAPDAFADGEGVWLELDHQRFFRSLAARFAN